jgi:tetratricopeptide (TPR) repeat protein
LVLAILVTLSYLVWRGEQQRQNAQNITRVTQGIAARFLDKLLTNKDISVEEARRRALDELPALVGLPTDVIEQLIAGKIAARVQDMALSPLERARAALAVGNYEAVFVESARQRVASRELAILEGTAALAQFRNDPQPSWHAKALAAFQRALALSDVTTQPLEWADAAVSVAYCLVSLAQYAEAEPLLLHALQLRESQYDPEHPDVATDLDNLASLYHVLGRYGEAEPRYQRALAIREKAFGPEHPDVGRSLNNLGLLYHAQGRYGEAEPRYQRALAIWEKAFGPKHPYLATVVENYVALLRATNRDAEAIQLVFRFRHLWRNF